MPTPFAGFSGTPDLSDLRKTDFFGKINLTYQREGSNINLMNTGGNHSKQNHLYAAAAAAASQGGIAG